MAEIREAVPFLWEARLYLDEFNGKLCGMKVFFVSLQSESSENSENSDYSEISDYSENSDHSEISDYSEPSDPYGI